MPGTDFIGFLDGIQARNLATIERDVELYLSDMQTRASMIHRYLRGGESVPADFATGISQVEATLRGHDGTVVDRLVGAGEEMSKLMIQYADFLRANELCLSQMRGFVRAFIGAAENSHNDRIITTAAILANTYEETKPA